MKYFVRDLLITSLDPRSLTKAIADRVKLKPTSFSYELLSAERAHINGKLCVFADFCLTTNEFIRDTSISFSEDAEEPIFPSIAKPSVVVQADAFPGLVAAYLLSREGNRPILISKCKTESELLENLSRRGGFIDRKSGEKYGRSLSNSLLDLLGDHGYSRFVFIEPKRMRLLCLALLKGSLDKGAEVHYGLEATSLRYFLGKLRSVDCRGERGSRSFKSESFVISSLPYGSKLEEEFTKRSSKRSPSYLGVYVQSKSRDVDRAIYGTSLVREPRYFHKGSSCLFPFPSGGNYAESDGCLSAAPCLLGEDLLGQSLGCFYFPFGEEVDLLKLKGEIAESCKRDLLPGSLPAEPLSCLLSGEEPYSFGLSKGFCPSGFHLASLPSISSSLSFLKGRFRDLKERYQGFLFDSSLVTGFSFFGAIPELAMPDKAGKSSLKGVCSCLSAKPSELDLTALSSFAAKAAIAAL